MADSRLMFDLLAKDSASSKFSEIGRAALEASGEMRAAFEKPVDVKIDTEGFDAYMAKLEAMKAMNAGAIQDIHVNSSRMLLDMEKAERDLDGLLGMTDKDLTKWATGGLKDAESSASDASGSVMSLTTGIGALGVALGAPALGAGVALLGGLVGILASAAAAAAPFGLAVMGTVKDMAKQQTAIKGAETHLASLTKGTKTYRQALEHLKALQHGFNQEFAPAAKGLAQVKTAWEHFLKASRPMVVQTLGMAFKVVSDVLPKLVPVVKAVGPAFIQLMGDLDNFIKSAGFRRFVSWAEKTGPSSILAVGHAIGKMAGAILAALPHLTGLMHWVENMSGGKLAAIIGGIGALAGAIALLGGGPIAAAVAVAALGTALVMAYKHSQPFRNAVNSIWSDIKAKFLPILHQVEAWFQKNWPTIQRLGAQALHALAGAFKSFVNLVSALWQRFGKGILDHAKNSIEGILKIFKGVFQIIGGVFQAFADLLTGKWSHLGADLKRIASGFWNIIKGLFQTVLGNLVDTVRSHGSQITGFFHSLPGRIRSALGNLGHLLWSAGQDLLNGLIGGIKSMVGHVMSTVGGIASSIGSHFKAALGIHSPSTVFWGFGQNIMQGLLNGIWAKRDSIVSVTSQVAADVVSMIQKMQAQRFQDAGALLIGGLIDGMNAKKKELKTVLSSVQSMIQSAAQQLQTDVQARISFEQSFQSTYAASPFSATDANGNPAGIRQMLGFEQAQLTQALQLKRDTRKLIKEGMSKSLVEQLANAGPSGLSQIHALASASAVQVHRMNRLNAQTNAALAGASNIAGHDIYGAKIAADKQAEHSAKIMAEEVRKAIHGEKIGASVHKAIKDGFSEAQIHRMTREGTKEGAALGSKAGAKELEPVLLQILGAVQNQAQQTLTKQRQHGGTRKKK